MDYSKVGDLQDRLVLSVSHAIHGEWDTAVVNMEVGEIQGELRQNCICLAFRRQQGDWVRDSFLLPRNCYALFVSLREQMAGSGVWTVCNLEICSDGRYKFHFSCDLPKRLNGVYDDEAMLSEYKPSC